MASRQPQAACGDQPSHRPLAAHVGDSDHQPLHVGALCLPQHFHELWPRPGIFPGRRPGQP
eukprot:9661608-Alexandrium_andersonii.AAC.1